MAVKSLNEVPIYRRFINERNRALDRIHWTSNRRISKIFRSFLERIALASLAHYRGVDQRGFIGAQVNDYVSLLVDELNRLRVAASVLAYAGEAQAIGLATGKEQAVKWDMRDSQEVSQDSVRDGELLQNRVRLALNRVVRKAIDAAELANVSNEDETEALERIISSFPKTKRYKRIPAPSQRLKEAANSSAPKTKLTGFISDDVWNTVVDWYRTDVIKVDRSPMGIIDMGEYYEQDDVYVWELEKELTEMFVKSVREGGMDAAKENGVEDFVWLAVIDDRTDDCCAWRNGLLLSEIEKIISEGKAPDGDECQDSLTPPIHFNCRCELAPATSDLIEPDPDYEAEKITFGEWLDG